MNQALLALLKTSGFFSGKKTHLVALGAIAFGVAVLAGVLEPTNEQLAAGGLIGMGALAAFLRLGVAKSGDGDGGLLGTMAAMAEDRAKGQQAIGALLANLLKDLGPPFLPEGFFQAGVKADGTFVIQVGDRDVHVGPDGQVLGAGTTVGDARAWKIEAAGNPREGPSS